MKDLIINWQIVHIKSFTRQLKRKFYKDQKMKG